MRILPFWKKVISCYLAIASHLGPSAWDLSHHLIFSPIFFVLCSHSFCLIQVVFPRCLGWMLKKMLIELYLVPALRDFHYHRGLKAPTFRVHLRCHVPCFSCLSALVLQQPCAVEFLAHVTDEQPKARKFNNLLNVIQLMRGGGDYQTQICQLRKSLFSDEFLFCFSDQQTACYRVWLAVSWEMCRVFRGT